MNEKHTYPFGYNICLKWKIWQQSKVIMMMQWQPIGWWRKGDNIKVDFDAIEWKCSWEPIVLHICGGLNAQLKLKYYIHLIKLFDVYISLHYIIINHLISYFLILFCFIEKKVLCKYSFSLI